MKHFKTGIFFKDQQSTAEKMSSSVSFVSPGAFVHGSENYSFSSGGNAQQLTEKGTTVPERERGLLWAFVTLLGPSLDNVDFFLPSLVICVDAEQ